MNQLLKSSFFSSRKLGSSPLVDAEALPPRFFNMGIKEALLLLLLLLFCTLWVRCDARLQRWRCRCPEPRPPTSSACTYPLSALLMLSLCSPAKKKKKKKKKAVDSLVVV